MALIVSITARIILHLTSFFQFVFDLFHIHHLKMSGVSKHTDAVRCGRATLIHYFCKVEVQTRGFD